MSIKDFMLCKFYLIKNIRIDELSLYLWKSFNKHDCFVSFHITWDRNIKLNDPLIDEVEGQAYQVRGKVYRKTQKPEKRTTTEISLLGIQVIKGGENKMCLF